MREVLLDECRISINRDSKDTWPQLAGLNLIRDVERSRIATDGSSDLHPGGEPFFTVIL